MYLLTKKIVIVSVVLLFILSLLLVASFTYIKFKNEPFMVGKYYREDIGWTSTVFRPIFLSSNTRDGGVVYKVFYFDGRYIPNVANLYIAGEIGGYDFGKPLHKKSFSDEGVVYNDTNKYLDLYKFGQRINAMIVYDTGTSTPEAVAATPQDLWYLPGLWVIKNHIFFGEYVNNQPLIKSSDFPVIYLSDSL